MAEQTSALPSFEVRDGRIERMLDRLPDFSADALLVLDLKNIRYLSGFSGSDGALFIGRDRCALLVDGRYTTQAREETSGLEVVEYREKIEGLAGVLENGRPFTVGFEAAAMTVETHMKLADRLKKTALRPLPETFRTIRAVKTEEELDRISTAAAIASRALASVLERIRPGMRERDIAADLEAAMIREGAEAVAFPTIVASGRNSARPHARPGLREIQRGDTLTIDYGAVLDGYHSDETCTVFVGRADTRQKEVYEIVREAQAEALKAVRAGVRCSEIDRIARSRIEAQGLGGYFSHGTGHGVGLDVHEFPRIAATSEDVLEAGMVVTVEPGVYIPGSWGVRIEDLALVRDGEPAVLSGIPKEMKILEI